MAKGNLQKAANGSALDFESQLWAAADKMCWQMDASEYKNVCPGLIFLKYISDAFEAKREQLLFDHSDHKSAWIQHYTHHLSPMGVAGLVMANDSMSTRVSNEGEMNYAFRFIIWENSYASFAA
jgi:type I restriction-modification system DNA methylase subunit